MVSKDGSNIVVHVRIYIYSFFLELKVGSVLKVLNLSPSSDQKNALYHVVCLIMCCRFSFIYV